MEDGGAADESAPASPAHSVRARAASPPAAERKEKEEVDISKHVAMMRARSKENDLEGAMQVFRKLQSSGVQLTSLAYNALLDSCVQCGKVNVALQHFKEMKDLGLVDVAVVRRCLVSLSPSETLQRTTVEAACHATVISMDRALAS